VDTAGRIGREIARPKDPHDRDDRAPRDLGTRAMCPAATAAGKTQPEARWPVTGPHPDGRFKKEVIQ
jgi:hypothetical protein